LPRAFVAPRREVLHVGERECLVHHALVFAAVIGDAGAVRVRQALRRDEIAAAQLDPVEAILARGDIDQPLENEHRLGAAGTTIGHGRRRVAEDAARFDIACLDVINPRKNSDCFAQRYDRKHMGAEIG
jgi:hypothetical protein